jgi:S1/P1 Nuclease.
MRLFRRTAVSVSATLAVAALCLGGARPAAAWWAPGHAVIAMMAYRQMQPATRTAVDEVLRQHPDYKNWLAELPAGVTEAQRGEYIFAIASTWPDRIKDAKDESVSVKFFNPGGRNPAPKPYPSAPALYPDLNVHDTWHYLDVPISMDGKPRTLPAEESVLTAIPTCRGYVAAAYLPGSYRAYYLSWLAHLVGDIHQPLHATGRFAAGRAAGGDAGGNAIRFKSDGSPGQPRNLHAYWDGLLGSGPDPNRYNTLQNGWAELNATIEKINADAPRLLAGYDPATRESTDERAWLMESFSVAQQVVYTFGDPDASGDLPQPDAEYRKLALRAAYQRAALAAHRLARVCDLAFEKKP